MPFTRSRSAVAAVSESFTAAPTRLTPVPASHRTPVRLMAAVTFLQWTGSSAAVPLLPLYLSRRAPAAMVGAVMAAFFVGGLLAQFAGGWLADRIGYRPVLILGLAGYAAASVGFALPVTGSAYAVLRALQGAGAGTATVASLALVAHRSRGPERGRAFATLNAAQLTGIAVGPLLGTLFGPAGMGSLCLVSGAVALLACVPVLTLPPDPPGDQATASALETGPAADTVPAVNTAADTDTVPAVDTVPAMSVISLPAPAVRLVWTGGRGRVLVGVLIATAVTGWINGVYESCWSLLLAARGAATWQVTVSWTLFAIPVTLVSPFAGRLVDRGNRRTLAIVALSSSAVFCASYAGIMSPAWLLRVGMFEALGVALAMPATQSLLAEAVPSGADGRGQGLFATVTTAAMAVACLSGGSLFSVSPWLPFAVGGAVAAAAIVPLPLIWRGLAVEGIGLDGNSVTGPHPVPDGPHAVPDGPHPVPGWAPVAGLLPEGLVPGALLPNGPPASTDAA